MFSTSCVFDFKVNDFPLIYMNIRWWSKPIEVCINTGVSTCTLKFSTDEISDLLKILKWSPHATKCSRKFNICPFAKFNVESPIVNGMALLKMWLEPLPWCTYKLLYFGVTLLWKLLWAQKRITQFFLPSPAVKLNLILILSLTDMDWKQYFPLLQPPASK